MTPDQQARERLAREATPGPWTTDTDANEQQMVLAVDADFWVALCPHQCLRSIEVQAEKNAKHIAANSPAVILADLARLRALEDAHEHLTRELALAHAEADAATERVQHLLATIDVERTGRKEAEDEVARLRGALGGLPSRFEVERLFGGACCERLLTPKGVGGVVFCDLLQDHIGSHEGAEDKGNRWWFNESGAGILRTTHPTTELPLEANRQIFASVYNRTLAAIDAALHAQDTEVGR